MSRSVICHLSFVIVLIIVLLLAWGLRLCCLDEVPPGWRDDELIEMTTLSSEVLAGRPTFYFSGASGHEPLYHTLRAGVIALWGTNSLTNHLLTTVSGTLAVALAYRLCRELFGRRVALLVAVLMATGFWPLMYSRFGVRHQMLVPLALAVFCLLWSVDRPVPRSWPRVLAGGIFLATALYTYTASRLIPLVLLAFGLYLALFHRERFRRWWRPLLVVLLLAAALTAPMWVAIAQNRDEAAAVGVGPDARIAELAVPLQALQAGDPGPLLENVWQTLGMFHATGDEEDLYNIPGRPVFNLVGGALLWVGIGLCLYRWRQPRYFFLLLWLGFGLAPTFVSIPPASLSHSILAQPVAYVLPVLPLFEAYRWVKGQVASGKWQVASGKALFVIFHFSLVILVATNVARDLYDYFVIWPRRELVRVLYRADYREAARFLDASPAVADVAISSTLLGPWDRVALDVDTRRDDVAVRLFDPGRAMVWCGGDAPSPVLLTTWPPAAAPLDGFLEAGADPPESVMGRLMLYRLSPVSSLWPQDSDPLARFANGLVLVDARWQEEPAAGREGALLTLWHVAAPLDLPPMPLVANPPPPGVYSGPRLKVFAHLLAADGAHVTGDDGLWVDPLTLRPGDYFVQVHRFVLTGDAPDGPYAVRLGLYDPKPGAEMRWDVLGEEDLPIGDHVLIQP